MEPSPIGYVSGYVESSSAPNLPNLLPFCSRSPFPSCDTIFYSVHHDFLTTFSLSLSRSLYISDRQLLHRLLQTLEISLWRYPVLYLRTRQDKPSLFTPPKKVTKDGRSNPSYGQASTQNGAQSRKLAPKATRIWSSRSECDEEVETKENMKH